MPARIVRRFSPAVAGWALLLAAGHFLTFPAAWLTGGIFYLRDFHPFFYPQKFFLASRLAEGEIPWWLPHAGCGLPFFASLQPGAAYPPALLLLLVHPFSRALQGLVLLHLLLALAGMGLLARRGLGLGRGPAALAAIAFGLGGFCVSTVSQLNTLQSAAWSPWVLLALLRAGDGRGWRPAWPAGALLALQLLGGGVEVTLLSFGAGLLLAWAGAGERRQQGPVASETEGESGAWTAQGLPAASGGVEPEPGCPPRRPGRLRWLGEWSGRWGWTAIPPLLALGLGAFQILPVLEASSRSLRAGGGLPYAQAARYSLEPAALANLAAPRRLADPGKAEYFAAFRQGRAPWLISLYPGLLVAHLALCGLLARGSRRRQRLALAAASLLGLLLALGDRFPPFRLLLGAGLPGLGWFRYPEKFFFLTALCLPLLAALGLQRLLGEEKESPADPAGRPAAPVGRRPRSSGTAWPLLLLLPAVGAALWAGLHGEGGTTLDARIPLFLLTLAGILLFLHGRGLLRAPLLGPLLVALAVADLAAAHRPLNALVPASFYSDPPRAARVILEDAVHRQGGLPGPPARVRCGLPGLPGGPPVTEAVLPTPLAKHWLWREYLSPNTSLLWGLAQDRGDNGLEMAGPAGRERLLQQVAAKEQLAWLGLWSVSYLLLDRPLDLPGELEELPAGGVPGQRIYRLRRSLPRAFLADRSLAAAWPTAERWPAAGGPAALRLLSEIRSSQEALADRGEGCRIVEYGEQRLLLEAVTAEPGRLLVFTDSWDPGWRCRVDGRKGEVADGPGGFCAVQLPAAGRQRVELRYLPRMLVPGVWVSAATVLLLLAFLLRPASRRPARRSEDWSRTGSP